MYLYTKHKEVRTKMQVELTRETIDRIFEDEENQEKPYQGHIAEKLYRIAFPNWDVINSIEGWPSVSNTTGTYIFRLFIDFDKKYHPYVMSGGLWFNKGFSTLNKTVPDWVINTDNVKVS